MPTTFQAITFNFEGSAEFRSTLNPNVVSPPVTGGDDPPQGNPTSLNVPLAEENGQADIVYELNQKADYIAQQIERELRKIIPPQFSVQAEVSFSAGSIVMTGTVLLFTWLGSIATRTVREEVENQFRDVIRVTIQRVMSRVTQPYGRTMGPMEIDSIRTSSPPTLALASEQTSEPPQPPEPPQPSELTESPASHAPLLFWLKLGIGLLVFNALLSLMLVVDRAISVGREVDTSESGSPPTETVTPAETP